MIDPLIIISIFLFSILLLVFSLNRTSKVFYLLIILMPTQSYVLTRTPFSLTSFNLLLLLLFIVVCLKNYIRSDIFLTRNLSFDVRSIWKIYLFIVISSCYFLFYFSFSHESINYFINIFGVFMLSYVGFSLTNNMKIILRVFHCIVLVGIYCSVIGILQAFDVIGPLNIGVIRPSRWIGFTQSYSLFTAAGSYGMVLNVALSCLLLLFFTNNLYHRIKHYLFLILFSTIIITAIYFSQSRSSYLALFLNLSVIILGTTFKVKRRLLFIVIPIIFLSMVLGSKYLMTKIQDLHYFETRSIESRIKGNLLAIEDWKENILFGTGFWQETKYYITVGSSSLQYDVALHNGLILILRYGGLVLFIPFLLIFILTIRILYKIFINAKRKEWSFSSLCLIGALTACLTELNFYMGISEKILWLTFALSLSYYNNYLKEKKKIGIKETYRGPICTNSSLA